MYADNISDGLLFRLNYDATEYIFYGAEGVCVSAEIPERRNGLPVTAAGNHAEGWNYVPLCGFAETERVILPRSLKKIYDSAFRRCGKLNEIAIPDLTAEIGNNAFSCCRSLTKITVGRGVKFLGRNAFAQCPSLTEILYFAENCETAGTLAYPVFKDCAALEKLILGEGVTSLPDYLFYGCANLSGVRFPDGLEFIGEYCFRDCKKIKRIYLPPSLKNIGLGAFENCTALSEVIFGGTAAEWDHINKNGWGYPAVKCKDGILNGAD